MRIKLFIFVLSILSFLYSESYNMQLLSFLSYEQNCSDITGFYQDDREFAVIGLQNAASFVDISDPYNPIELGRIDGSVSIWRDLKYWDRHVYIGTEANDGIKIVSVDNPDNPVLVNTIEDVDNSHNVHVDNDGYLYISVGDGGSTGDPENRAQDLSSLFGKILRIELMAKRTHPINFKNFVSERTGARFIVQPWFSYIGPNQPKIRVTFPTNSLKNTH